VLPVGERGGLALLSGYVDNVRAARARDGGAVLLIDAGDMWQGTLESNLTEGASVVAAYNALGYTAAAIGNHEFDFGPAGPAATPQAPTDDPRGALKARAAEAAFPLLAANLIDSATGNPVDWRNVKPSILVQPAGVKVGIIGVMTASALTATHASNTRGLTVAPLVDTIAAEARKLRAEGAVAIVVTAHAGGRCTQFQEPGDLSSCDPSSEIMNVARGLPRDLVDVIIAGHVHAAMAHEVAGIAITSAFTGGRTFGRVDLAVDRSTGRVAGRKIFPPRDLCAREDARTGTCDPTTVTGQPLTVARYEGTAVTPDARITQVLAPAVQRAAEIKAAPLGVFLETPVRRAGVDSPLGNLVTDALRESVAGAHVALNNTSGGLRADLPRGPLTYGSVYEMIPFDNLVVQFNLTGAELKRVMATQLQGRDRPIGISGIRVRAHCTGGALVVSLLHASGSPIRDDERLLVVTTDFLATGGGGLLSSVMPAQGFAIPDTAPLARDVVAERLRRRGGVLREDQLVDPSNPRWVYAGALPINCAM
jgi:5'-nucleotidase